MTIEEEFFHTFNISKQIMCSYSDTCYNGSVIKDCEGCNSYRYPEITSEILLELICIVTRYMNEICQFDSVDELKKATLEELIMLVEDDNFHEKCYEDVQSLFERGAEE